jgi:Protein of unknown function (DUF5132)
MGPALPAAALLLLGIGLGAKGGDLLRKAAPRVGRASRPFVKATIRSGYMVTREMRQLAESVREDLEDITAEAVIESETAAPKPSRTRNGGPANQPSD